MGADNQFKDLTNQTFNRLTARWPIARKNHQVLWLCSCSCGKLVVVGSGHLRTGHSKSCGCFNLEQMEARFVKHGHSRQDAHTAEYRIWKGIIQRCTNPHVDAYRHYGGRGIKVCKRWEDFKNFLADVGLRPNRSLTIDRIDNDGNYEPGNIRWATRSQQLKNRRPMTEETKKKLSKALQGNQNWKGAS